MNDRYSSENIEQFIDDYNFTSGQLQLYQKLKLYTIIVSLISAVFMLICVYGSFIFLAYLINYFLYHFLDASVSSMMFENRYLYLLFFVVLVISFTGYFSMTWIIDRIRVLSDEYEVTDDKYHYYKLSQSFRYFDRRDYDKSLKHLSLFSRKTQIPIVGIPVLNTALSLLFRIFTATKRTLHPGIDTFSEQERKYIDEYINNAYTDGEIDITFVENTFEDFFGLLLESEFYPKSQRELMFEAINGEIASEFEVPSDSTETPPTSFKEITKRIFKSTPNIERVWLLYVAAALIGISLVRINGTLAVIVVTVFVSAISAYYMHN